MNEAEPQQADKVPEAPLPKYRMISNTDLLITESVLNQLSAEGYELQAVSEKFMLMVLPTVSPQDEQLARIIALQERHFAEQNPNKPGEDLFGNRPELEF